MQGGAVFDKMEAWKVARGTFPRVRTFGGRTMKTVSVRNQEKIRLYGRFPLEAAGVPLYWSASGAEFWLRGGSADIEIECAYRAMKPYLSFEVDGLRAQTFVPLKGKHWYSLLAGMDPNKAHHVRIIKETQPFESDRGGSPVLLRLRYDGELQPLPPHRRKLVFIGDSITSAEGGRGPKSFQEWMPMMFGASDGYARIAAEKLRADFEVVSQSGWGVFCGYDNDPNHALPRIFGSVCALQDGGEGECGAFAADAVIIALGANDRGALSSAPWTDPRTGEKYLLTDTEEGMQAVEDAAFAFLVRLHEKYPAARLHWLSFYAEGPVSRSLKRAAERADAAGLPADYSDPVTFDRGRGMSPGSRSHPGRAAHAKIASAVVKLLKEDEKSEKA